MFYQMFLNFLGAPTDPPFLVILSVEVVIKWVKDAVLVIVVGIYVEMENNGPTASTLSLNFLLGIRAEANLSNTLAALVGDVFISMSFDSDSLYSLTLWLVPIFFF